MNVLNLDGRETARYISLTRFGIGFACVVTPRRVARVWLGDAEWEGTPVTVRAIGARDIAIAIGTLTSLDHGGDVGAWLRAGATADAADTAAIVLAFRSLRGVRRWLLPVVSGVAAYVGLELAGELED
jgi:hypothetical protein